MDKINTRGDKIREKMMDAIVDLELRTLIEILETRGDESFRMTARYFHLPEKEINHILNRWKEINAQKEVIREV